MIQDKTLLIKVFIDIAEILDRERKSIVEILSEIEPVYTAQIEVTKTIQALRTYDLELAELSGKLPFGEAYIFLPFNNPLYSFILYCFGPLLSGNKVIVRPSSLTSSSLLRIVELLSYELQKLNVEFFSGSGHQFIELISGKEKAKVIIFTGSWENLVAIEQKILQNNKLIYCGSGKCSFIILEDANIKAAVRSAIYSKVFNSGQDCLATEKFYLHEHIAEDFLSTLISEIKKIKFGRSADKDNIIRPLISEAFSDHIKKILDAGSKDRLGVVYSNIEGRLIPPMVFVTSEFDPLFEAEKFAPIFTITQFKDIDKVVESINQSDFRLGCSIFGQSIRFRDKLDIPHIAINDSVLSLEEDGIHSPFGGKGKSGFVKYNGSIYDGPILFSLESTI